MIAAHERLVEQRDRLTRMDSAYHERYQALVKRFEVSVQGLREELQAQRRRMLAESRRITTGDNLSLQKVREASACAGGGRWLGWGRRMVRLVLACARGAT